MVSDMDPTAVGFLLLPLESCSKHAVGSRRGNCQIVLSVRSCTMHSTIEVLRSIALWSSYQGDHSHLCQHHEQCNLKSDSGALSLIGAVLCSSAGRQHLTSIGTKPCCLPCKFFGKLLNDDWVWYLRTTSRCQLLG